MFILLFYLLIICAASLFSVGLAAHSNRFTSHHRTVYFHLVIFVMFFALCITGLISIATFEGEKLRTDPKTNWLAEDEQSFPYFPE
jgi:cytochrome b561